MKQILILLIIINKTNIIQKIKMQKLKNIIRRIKKNK